MANDGKITSLSSLPAADRTANVLEVVSSGVSYKTTPNFLLGITGNPVGTSDSQSLTNKTLTSPTISSPVLSGTITGTYTIGGTPTFPSSVATLTGSQTLTNKVLTSPTINTPTITNASITADSISGFSTANSGTIYGIPVTSAAISGSSLTNSTVTASKLSTGAAAAAVATSETTTSTSYADLATVTDTVTVTIGANGLALVALSANLFNNTINNSSYMSFAISGAFTQAGSDAFCVSLQSYTGSGQATLSGAFLATGITAGSCTFKAKYKVSGNTGTFSNRRISVVPL